MGGRTLSAPRVLARSELEWTDYESGRFGARVADLARPLGAVKLGYNLQEIPPGKASVPYHAHFVNEEMIVLLEGEAWVRLDGREHRLVAPALVALPPGRESAHQIVNRSYTRRVPTPSRIITIKRNSLRHGSCPTNNRSKKSTIG